MAQDLTATTSIMALVEANRIFSTNDSYGKSIKPRVDIVNSIMRHQSSDVVYLDGIRCKTARVFWTENCTNNVVDKTNDCTFSNANVESKVQDYTIGIEKEVVFSISDDLCNNDAEFEKILAKEYLKNITDLDNQIELDIIAKVDSFAGINQYTNDGRGTVAGALTTINAQYWNSSLISYFAKVAGVNGMDNAYMLSGENMHDAYFNSMMNSGNANGVGNSNLMNALDWSFDATHFDNILGSRKTLMVSPDALALVHYTKFNNEEFVHGANFKRFTIDSINIPGLKYDVSYNNSCLNGGDDIMHNFKLVARYDLFNSPHETCAGAGTGVLAFECA